MLLLANLEVKRLGLSTHGTDARPIHSQIWQRDYKKRKNFLDTSCESDKQWNWGMSHVAFPQLYIAQRKYSQNKAPDCQYSELCKEKVNTAIKCHIKPTDPSIRKTVTYFTKTERSGVVDVAMRHSNFPCLRSIAVLIYL